MSHIVLKRHSEISEKNIQKLLEIFKRIHCDNVWSKVTKDDFIVKRFETGIVNDISLCILTEDAQKRFAGNRSPTGIVVKVFPEKPHLPTNVLHRAVICSMISDNKLGPKLIYVDEECAVNEYIEGSRNYTHEDDKDEKFVKHVIRSLARYHNLSVPVPVTFKESWVDNFAKFLTDFPGSALVWNGKYLDLIDENPELKHLREVYEKVDFKFLHYLIEAQHELESPLVFSHMDFHRENRLVKETTLPTGEKIKEFYFVDLDSSLYSYRAFDLAAFFDSLFAPEAMCERETLADDKIILKFIEEYRQECARIVGKQYLDEEINSPEQILREVKFFILNYSLGISFFVAAMFAHNPKEKLNIHMLVGTHRRLILFQKLKETIH